MKKKGFNYIRTWMLNTLRRYIDHWAINWTSLLIFNNFNVPLTMIWWTDDVSDLMRPWLNGEMMSMAASGKVVKVLETNDQSILILFKAKVLSMLSFHGLRVHNICRVTQFAWRPSTLWTFMTDECIHILCCKMYILSHKLVLSKNKSLK